MTTNEAVFDTMLILSHSFNLPLKCELRKIHLATVFH